jgi:hypothetical protein
MDEAQRSIISPSEYDKEELQKQRKKLVSDLSDGVIFAPWDDLNSIAQQQIKDIVGDGMMANATAGMKDQERNAAVIKGSLPNHITTIPDYEGKEHMVLRGSPRVLASQIGVHENDLGSVVKSYLKANEQVFRDRGGDGMRMSEVVVDVSPHRGTFIIRDGGSTSPLTTVLPLAALKEGYSALPDINPMFRVTWRSDYDTPIR